eukprot:1145594-Pelagomonas_calceolata.AAC.3
MITVGKGQERGRMMMSVKPPERGERPTNTKLPEMTPRTARCVSVGSRKVACWGAPSLMCLLSRFSIVSFFYPAATGKWLDAS